MSGAGRPTHSGLDAFRKVTADLKPRRLTDEQRRALLLECFPSLRRLWDGDVTVGWLTIMHACRDHHPDRSDPLHTGACSRERCADPNRNNDEFDLPVEIIRDMAKHSQSVAGRSGPKPGALNQGEVYEMFRQFAGEDHTTLPFGQVFTVLMAGRSVRAMAAKCGLDRNKVHRLARGKASPTRRDMELVAAAFKKHASFFIEYRIQYLQDEMRAQLEELPEASIDLYRKRLNGRSGR